MIESPVGKHQADVEVTSMIELTNVEAAHLSALLVRVGRPHSREEAFELEQWVLRLNRGRTPDVHGNDLMAVYPLA